MKFISTQGYKRNSPDVNRPLNVIPSGRITMQDVDFPVRGVDNLGNEMFMVPGGEYFFPGDYVVETPMMQRGGQTNNDREMVEGIADILTMVKDPVNRRQIAAEMVRDFKREGVKYDLQEFQKMAQVRMQRGGLTFQQYYTPAAESTGANYTPIMTVQTAEKLKAQRDAQELARRRQAIQASQAAASKPLRERLTPENLAQETGATGDKLRFFPNDPDSFIDDYLNPLKMVGDMASGLGRIPLNVKQGNYGAAALDVAIPVATGALAGLGAKSAGQFVNNLANPLAGTGQFLTTKTPLKNAYNLLPEGSFSGYSKLRNADKSYRVAGMDAYDDFVESGVLRSNAPNPPAGASLEERVMLSRPTGFPSFQKGFADLRYLPDNGGVVFETSLPTFKRGEINPVTGQRIKGRHYAHRVIDPNTGATMSNIPGENISVYESFPHWLRGYKEIPKPKTLPGSANSKFQSEIDWSKWNPDTPKYPELINEYNAIEESTKKAGTWMKNADGSPFQGTPEQFIQQQSSWFKKAFPNPVRKRRPDFYSNKISGGVNPKTYFDENQPVQYNYHGSPNKFDFFDESKFSTGAFGKGIYTSIRSNPGYGENIYQLYLNANNPQPVTYTKSYDLFSADELNAVIKQKLLDYKNMHGFDFKGNPRDLLTYGEEMNKPKILSKAGYQQLEPGRDYFNPAQESDQSVVPFSNYPKSAIGNVGFFDMSNPNIYKAAAPIGIGLGTTTTQEYQKGGYITSPAPTYFGGTLPEVMVSSDDTSYPYYNKLTAEERKYFNQNSPIGRAVRSIASTGKRGETANDLREIARGVEEFGAEMTGIPGSIRFSQDPVKKLKGLGRTVEATILGSSPFITAPYNKEDVADAFDALDALGFATTTAGLAKMPLQKAANLTGRYLAQGPLKNAYRLNPVAAKQPTEVILSRVQRPGQTADLSRLDELLQRPPESLTLAERIELARMNQPGYGRGFSSNPSDISYYSSPSIIEHRGYAGLMPEIRTIRLSAEEAARFNLRQNPVLGKGYGSLSPSREYLLPRNYVESSKTLTPQTFEELEQIRRALDAEKTALNTPHWWRGYPKSTPNSYDDFVESGVVRSNAPNSLAGAGNLAANAAAKSSLFGDIKSGLQDLGHIYDQSLGYLFNNRANKRAIAEGNEWLRNWIQHPATQAKIDNDFADKINRSFVKDVYDLGYEQAKNFTPVSTELPLSVQLAKGFYPNKGNWGVSYLHGVDPMPRRMIEQGQMDAPIWHGSFISRTLDLPYKKRVGTTIHEGTHDWASRFALETSGQREFLERNINPEIHQDLEYWRRHGDDKTRADLGKKRRYQAYLADPTEQHARIMELRKYLGHTPDFVSTPEYAQKVMNHLSAMPRHKRPIDSEGFFKVFDNDPQKLSNMFNRLWGVTPVVVAGAAAASKKQDAQPTMQEYKLGGYISKQVGGEPDPEMMFRDKYNTLLKPEEERKFNRWAAKESKRQGRDILMDMGSYDVRGFWKSGDYKRMDQDNHGSDTWKKPNHPTFSNHSRYHGANGWYGGNWTDEGGYQPSKQTLQMYGPDYYQWMFGTEPNRPEHLDMSRYKSGINAPTPLYYKKGGQHGGLDRWFAEKWVDIKTGKECGRQEGEKRAGYPACRPSKRISEDTPKTASELSSSEKEKFKRSKTSSERISYQHKRKQDGGEWLDKYENTKENRQKVDQLFGSPAAGNVNYVPVVESLVGGFSAGLSKNALAPVVKSSLRSLQKYMEMQENPFVKIDLPVFNEAKNWLNKYDDQVTTK